MKDEVLRQQLLQKAIEQDLSICAIRDRVVELRQTASLVQVESPEPTLRSRFERAIRQSKKSQVWDDSKKKKRIEKLLGELQSLIEMEVKGND